MSYENPRNSPGERPGKIQLNGQEFLFVVVQRGGNSAIYKSKDSFLRIGTKEKILADLALHKKMEAAGFPVARVIAEGNHNGQLYFMESSLGDTHLGALFANDVEKREVISAEQFESFVLITEKFARAQLTTRRDAQNYTEFAQGILLQKLSEELPEHAEGLGIRFQEVQEKTKQLPFVVTHGDFNPNNLYSKGVIDLEDSFHAPYGYDLVSAMTHINYFPDSKDYEFYAKYRFTSEQKKKYFERMDAISTKAGLPPLSRFKEDFEFCRAIWLAAKLNHIPKLQEFRYDMVIDKFLK